MTAHRASNFREVYIRGDISPTVDGKENISFESVGILLDSDTRAVRNVEHLTDIEYSCER